MHQLNNHEGTCYNCDQCNYKATQHTNMILHKQSKHEDVEYLWGQCGFKGIGDASLGKHTVSYHRGKKYFCDHCSGLLHCDLQLWALLGLPFNSPTFHIIHSKLLLQYLCN